MRSRFTAYALGKVDYLIETTAAAKRAELDRDDLADGGASIVAASIEAIRRRSPGVGVEVLISDLKGSAQSLAVAPSAQ